MGNAVVGSQSRRDDDVAAEQQQQQQRRDDEVVTMKYCFFKNVQHQSWASVEQAVSSSPVLAAQRDAFGCTTLHLVCSLRPPPSTLVALLDACPEAARARDGRGRSPLHVAVAHGADAAAVDCLVSRAPDAARARDDRGRTPLHAALASRSSGVRRHHAFPWDVFRTLLREQDRASVAERRDARGATPLRAAWESSARAPRWEDARDVARRYREERWRALEALLRVCDDDDDRANAAGYVRIAASLADCPAGLFRALVERYGERERADADHALLFVAVSREFSTETDDAKSVVTTLLETNPAAAAVQTRGWYPLHAALRHGRTWRGGAVEELFAAYPEATRTPDPSTGVPLFAMPALYRPKEDHQDEDAPVYHNNNNDDDGANTTDEEEEEEEEETPTKTTKQRRALVIDHGSTETVYELLRADPSVLRRYCHR